MGVLGGGDQIEVIQGDADDQSYIGRSTALDDRARACRPAGLPVDGMLFPSIRDVNATCRVRGDDVPTTSTYDTSTCRRTTSIESAAATTSTSRPRSCAHDLGEAAGAPITDDELNALDPGLQREPQGGAASCTPIAPKSPWQVPGRRALPGAARRHGAAGRGAHGHLLRDDLGGRRRRGQRPRRDKRPRRAQRLVLRAAPARSDQVDRDGEVVTSLTTICFW